MERFKFCQKCHHKVDAPKMLMNANIKSETGKINVECPYCKSKVKFTLNKQIEKTIE